MADGGKRIFFDKGERFGVKYPLASLHEPKGLCAGCACGADGIGCGSEIEGLAAAVGLFLSVGAAFNTTENG